VSQKTSYSRHARESRPRSTESARAKELLEAYRASAPEAVAEVHGLSSQREPGREPGDLRFARCAVRAGAVLWFSKAGRS